MQPVTLNVSLGLTFYPATIPHRNGVFAAWASDFNSPSFCLFHWSEDKWVLAQGNTMIIKWDNI